MRNTGWLAYAVVGLVGCIGPTDDAMDPDPDPDPQTGPPTGDVPLAVPGACAYHASLYGMADGTGTSGNATFDAVNLDANGVTICVELDARDNIWVAHFGAGAGPREMGEYSSYRLTLFDANDILLRDGWDVAFGSSPTMVFASLELGVEKGTVLNGKLLVRKHYGPPSSETITMSLFEPYE